MMPDVEEGMIVDACNFCIEDPERLLIGENNKLFTTVAALFKQLLALQGKIVEDELSAKQEAYQALKMKDDESDTSYEARPGAAYATVYMNCHTCYSGLEKEMANTATTYKSWLMEDVPI
jgi:hypothetical protein